MLEVRRATVEELSTCLAIRRTVFIEGQDVPESDEVDGLDPQCVHVLAFADGAPIGTARLRTTADGHAKIERVAVLAEHRGGGVGHAIMASVEDAARAQGHREVVLGAQLEVVSFYERRGYVAEGAVFMDAGIPHRMMRLSL